MEPQQKRLGRTGLKLSTLGFGGTGLGNMYAAMSEKGGPSRRWTPLTRPDCVISTRPRCMDTVYPS